MLLKFPTLIAFSLFPPKKNNVELIGKLEQMQKVYLEKAHPVEDFRQTQLDLLSQ